MRDERDVLQLCQLARCGENNYNFQNGFYKQLGMLNPQILKTKKQRRKEKIFQKPCKH